MLHPSIESTNSTIIIGERPPVLSQQAVENLRESGVTASSRTREEERSSPVCAAGWAY